MSSFSDVKKEIFDAAKASGKTSFSEGTFNKLTSALVNEPDYEVKVSKTRGGVQKISYWRHCKERRCRRRRG